MCCSFVDEILHIALIVHRAIFWNGSHKAVFGVLAWRVRCASAKPWTLPKGGVGDQCKGGALGGGVPQPYAVYTIYLDNLFQPSFYWDLHYTLHRDFNLKQGNPMTTPAQTVDCCIQLEIRWAGHYLHPILTRSPA